MFITVHDAGSKYIVNINQIQYITDIVIEDDNGGEPILVGEIHLDGNVVLLTDESSEEILRKIYARMVK